MLVNKIINSNNVSLIKKKKKNSNNVSLKKELQ